MNPLEKPLRMLLAEANRVHPVSADRLAQGCPTCDAIVEAEKALIGFEFESAPVPEAMFETALCCACESPLPDGWESNLCRECMP